MVYIKAHTGVKCAPPPTCSYCSRSLCGLQPVNQLCSLPCKCPALEHLRALVTHKSRSTRIAGDKKEAASWHLLKHVMRVGAPVTQRAVRALQRTTACSQHVSAHHINDGLGWLLNPMQALHCTCFLHNSRDVLTAGMLCCCDS
jgi:hypothetical protein